MKFNELWAKAKELGWKGRKAKADVLKVFVETGKVPVDTAEVEPVEVKGGHTFKNVSSVKLSVFGINVMPGKTITVDAKQAKILSKMKKFK